MVALNDLPDLLAASLDYPTEVAVVRSEIGDVELDAPDREDSKTVGELLSHVDGDTYQSPNELLEVITSVLPDDYIGRKYYDDRGANPNGADDREPRDEQDRSF